MQRSAVVREAIKYIHRRNEWQYNGLIQMGGAAAVWTGDTVPCRAFLWAGWGIFFYIFIIAKGGETKDGYEGFSDGRDGTAGIRCST